MADQLSTARPVSTFATASLTLTGGATAHAILSDNSDASYIHGGTNATATVDFGVPSPAIPVGAQIRSVNIKVRQGNEQGRYLETRLGETLDRVYYFTQSFITDLAITNVFGTSRNLTVQGIAWNPSALWAYLKVGGSSVRIYEAYAEVYYNVAAVATPSAPTGSVTTTTRPDVVWSYTDAESDIQERYVIKVFSAAQYGAGGFDPETSTPTWTSGEVFSASTVVKIGMDLDNGVTYRAYVKVADTGSNGRYSAWANTQFLMAVTAPPAPTLVATAQPANATGPRTKLDITRTVSATPTTFMVIEYSDNGGVTWGGLAFNNSEAYIVAMADAEKILNTPDGTTFTFYDYTAIPGVTRSYRAKGTRTV